MKYFNPRPRTFEELKAQYRKLAIKHHPDKGGDAETMKAINNEYDELFPLLKNKHASKEGKVYEDTKNQTTERPEDFRNIIDLLLRIPNIEIELCGRWLWISGDTKPHREELKAAGCRWASKKSAWYWHRPEDAVHKSKGKSMEYIREVYGSVMIEGTASHGAERSKPKQATRPAYIG